MLEALSEEQWKHWEEQGYVRLGVQLTGAEVAQLQQRCDDLMMGTADGVDFSMLRMVREKAQGGIRDGIGQDIGHRGATLEYSKFQGLEHDPVFFQLMSQPLMRCAACTPTVLDAGAAPAAYTCSSARGRGCRVETSASIGVCTGRKQRWRCTERRCSTNQYSLAGAGSVGSES